MRRIGLFASSIFLASLIAGGTAVAGEDCTCRANGQDVAEGQTVCLQLPSGAKLAKCSRVLNNTAWEIIQDGCPIGQAQPDQSTIVQTAAG